MKNTPQSSARSQSQSGSSRIQSSGQPAAGGFMGAVSSAVSSLHLDEIPGQIQHFGEAAVDTVSNLSTTQKVVGGALLAAGAGWIAMRAARK